MGKKTFSDRHPGLILVLIMLGMLCMLWLIERHDILAQRCEKKMFAAIEKNDFEEAHVFLNELLLHANADENGDGRGEDYHSKWIDQYYVDVHKLLSAEIRFLVDKNTEASWSRAYLLPMEVDEKNPTECKRVQKVLYEELLEYADAFKNEEMQAKIKEKLRLTSTSL